jgi:hypothetical protein
MHHVRNVTATRRLGARPAAVESNLTGRFPFRSFPCSFPQVVLWPRNRLRGHEVWAAGSVRWRVWRAVGRDNNEGLESPAQDESTTGLSGTSGSYPDRRVEVICSAGNVFASVWRCRS